MQTAIGVAFDALAAASVMMVVAVGFFAVLVVLRIYNMAYGEFVTLGAYTAAFTVPGRGGWVSAYLLAPILCATLAAAIEPALGRLSSRTSHAGLLFTWGLSLVLIQTIRLLVGPSGKAVDLPALAPLEFAGVIIPTYNLFTTATALALVLLFSLIWLVSPVGDLLRAVSDNPSAAEGLGISARVARRWTFIGSSMLAGLVGVLVSPISAVSPTMGSQYTIIAVLTVLVLGGNSFVGVMVGALILGVTRSIVGYMCNPALGTSSMLAIVVVVLLIRAAAGRDV